MMRLVLSLWDSDEMAHYDGKHTASCSPCGGPDTRGERRMVQSLLAGFSHQIPPHLTVSTVGIGSKLLTLGPLEDVPDLK